MCTGRFVMNLLAAVTLHMCRSRLSESPTVCTLRNWATLLVDMDKWSIWRIILATALIGFEVATHVVGRTAHQHVGNC